MPCFRLKTVGSRAFAVAGATVWNHLPTDISTFPSLSIFRQRLKTFLFRRSYPAVLCIKLLLFLLVDLAITVVI